MAEITILSIREPLVTKQGEVGATNEHTARVSALTRFLGRLLLAPLLRESDFFRGRWVRVISSGFKFWLLCGASPIKAGIPLLELAA